MTETTSPPYSAFAGIYDRVSGQAGFELYAPAYEALMKRVELGSGAVLDVACGTGLWARRLAELGFEATGLDRSAAMLARARRRCRGLPVRFVRGEMTALPFEGGFHLVTCTYDSLNYLAGERALEATLAGFKRALVPGGAAMFDTNTAVALREHWASQTIVRRTGGVVCLWTTRWDRRSRSNTLTMECFTPCRGRGGLYRRSVEVHVERALEPEQVRRAARAAGFSSFVALDIETLSPAGPSTGKAIFVAGTRRDGGARSGAAT